MLYLYKFDDPTYYQQAKCQSVFGTEVGSLLRDHIWSNTIKHLDLGFVSDDKSSDKTIYFV